ncbi:MAG: hypothetical protein QNJ51_24910 [Calothrix sp. MO_167.B12]|nr:hypothetical protein [Calothrix sp. MO_167.B12]
MGKASQRKQKARLVLQTLTSNEFSEHIHRTLMGMPEKTYQPLMEKLLSNIRAGVSDKWVGMVVEDTEFRIGYEASGNCYTMAIINEVGHCYNFSPDKPIYENCIPTPATKFTPFTRTE